MLKTSKFSRMKASAKELRNVRSLTGISLFAAMKMILHQFGTIRISNVLHIGFSFLAQAMGAYLYGPWLAGLAGIVTDTLSYFLSPDGPYSPFFAINEFLIGFLYGCYFYQKPITKKRVFFACLTVTIVINLFLTPIWLQMLYGKAEIFSTIRLIKNLLQLPINVALLYTLLKITERYRTQIQSGR